MLEQHSVNSAESTDMSKDSPDMSKRPSGQFAQQHVTIGNLQIVSALDELFNHYDQSLPMWGGTGDRSVTVAFEFDTRFDSPPSVTAGVVGMDSDEGHNLRFWLHIENITEKGFDLRFATWADTRIARTAVSWQAIGQTVARKRTATAVAKKPAAKPKTARQPRRR